MVMRSQTLYFHPGGHPQNTSLWNSLFSFHLILHSGVTLLCPSHPRLSFCELFHCPLECQLHGKLHWTFTSSWKSDSPENVTSPAVPWSCSYTSALGLGSFTNYCPPSSYSLYLPGCFPFTVICGIQDRFTHHETFSAYGIASLSPPTLHPATIIIWILIVYMYNHSKIIHA